MANLDETLKGLVDAISAAMVDADMGNVIVGSEWPARDALSDAALQQQPIIAVVHKFTHYQDLLPFEHSETTSPIGIASSLSDFSLAPDQSVVLSLTLAEDSEAVGNTDSVSLQISNGEVVAAATASAGPSTTLEQLAQLLADDINDKLVDFGIVAVADDESVTVSNSGAAGFHVLTHVGNASIVKETVKWGNRNIQVTAWTGDLAVRSAIRLIVEEVLSNLDRASGFFLPSEEWVRFSLDSSKPDDANTDKDIFTDIFIVTAKAMVDVTTEKWAIIATIPQVG